MKYSHVYIDESGDFGRSDRSSRHLVVTSIATSDPRRLDKIVRKIWVTKQHKKMAGELHAIDATDSVIFKLLSLIDEQNIEISFTYVDKVAFTKNIHIQYYKMIAQQVNKYKNAQFFVVDKRDTNKKRDDLLRSLGLKTLFKKVEFADSRSVRQLQAVDFVSWSIFQHLERGNASYTEGIKTKIKESLPL